ncbi:hypothetical protein [Helicobacter canis]|uniref:hypothetical protein n=1 Tax=Helicobacter canis TaxID=29419 RepID=UPI00294309D3|nr:hypothetical protein [Helicobacter canis]
MIWRQPQTPKSSSAPKSPKNYESNTAILRIVEEENKLKVKVKRIARLALQVMAIYVVLSLRSPLGLKQSIK